MEKRPKPLTEEEAEIELLDEGFFELDNIFFNALGPDMAEELKPDFKQYMEIQAELRKTPEVGHSLEDLEKKFPNNRWIKYLKSILTQMSSSEKFTKKGQEGFRLDVEKRIKGEDIN